jgi:hypothetical protein
VELDTMSKSFRLEKEAASSGKAPPFPNGDAPSFLNRNCDYFISGGQNREKKT